MNIYINQGRFGEFVTNIIELTNKEKKEAFEKDDENKMWELYLHSHSDKSFNKWKEELLNGSPESNSEPNSPSNVQSLSMTNAEIDNVKESSRNILKKFKI